MYSKTIRLSYLYFRFTWYSIKNKNKTIKTKKPLQTLISPKEQRQLKSYNRSVFLSLSPHAGQVWITKLLGVLLLSDQN